MKAVSGVPAAANPTQSVAFPGPLAMTNARAAPSATTPLLAPSTTIDVGGGGGGGGGGSGGGGGGGGGGGVLDPTTTAKLSPVRKRAACAPGTATPSYFT